MKGVTEPAIVVAGNGSEATIESSAAQASPAERTIVIVLAQVVVLVALIVIWRVLTRSDEA